jgi:hypothetical protein
MLVGIGVVQLQRQRAGRVGQHLVVRPAVGALQAQQLLIPPARRLDVVGENHRLERHGAPPDRGRW